MLMLLPMLFRFLSLFRHYYAAAFDFRYFACRRHFALPSFCFALFLPLLIFFADIAAAAA